MAVTWLPELPPEVPNINNNGYYKVVLSGACQGQDITNVLWYRVGIDLIPGDWNLFGVETLAQGVYNQVWADPNRMRTLMSTFYTLVDIQVYPLNGLFTPLFASPFVRSVNEAGLRSGALVGPDTTYTAAFNLEPTSIFNGFAPPRKGHLKVGPCIESDIPDSGIIGNTHRDFVYQRLIGVSQDISTPLPFPGSFFPIRVSTATILGVPTLRGWADVSSIIIRATRSTLRRRRAEA